MLKKCLPLLKGGKRLSFLKKLKKIIPEKIKNQNKNESEKISYGVFILEKKTLFIYQSRVAHFGMVFEQNRYSIILDLENKKQIRILCQTGFQKLQKNIDFIIEKLLENFKEENIKSYYKLIYIKKIKIFYIYKNIYSPSFFKVLKRA